MEPQKLRALVALAGFKSWLDLERRTGVCRITVWRQLQGRQTPTRRSMSKLATALGLSVEVLATMLESEQPQPPRLSDADVDSLNELFEVEGGES